MTLSIAAASRELKAVLKDSAAAEAEVRSMLTEG